MSDPNKRAPEPRRFLPDVPLSESSALQNLLGEMKNHIEDLYQTVNAPPQVSGFTVTSTDLAAKLSWNATLNTDSYVIWRSSTSSFDKAVVLTKEGGLSHIDPFAQSAVGTKKYYWVQAESNRGKRGPLSRYQAIADPGVRVIAGVFKTAESGQRIEIDSVNGLRAIDSLGNIFIQIPVAAFQDFVTSFIRPVATAAAAGVIIQNGDQTANMVLRNTSFTATLSAGNILQLAATALLVTLAGSPGIVLQVTSTSSASTTNISVLSNGTLVNVKTDVQNFGSGTKAYLYI